MNGRGTNGTQKGKGPELFPFLLTNNRLRGIVLLMKLRYFLIFFLCLLSFSCSGRDTSTPPPAATPHLEHVKAGNFADGQLQAHFLKHAYQFGDITQSDYLDDARALLNAPADQDILEKIRPNGDILHYRRSTGEFAVMAADGRIRTFFKADIRYWMKQ